MNSTLTIMGIIGALICIGIPIAMLGAFLFESWRESREYNDEHDLP